MKTSKMPKKTKRKEKKVKEILDDKIGNILSLEIGIIL